MEQQSPDKQVRVLTSATRADRVIATVLVYGGTLMTGGSYMLLVAGLCPVRGAHMALLLGGIATITGNVALALGLYARWVDYYLAAPWGARFPWLRHWLRLQGIACAVAPLFYVLLVLIRLFFEHIA